MTALALLNAITNQTATAITADAIAAARLIVWQASDGSNDDIMPSDWQQAWYLLGTDGCHLCDDIKAQLAILAPRLMLPPIKVLDVMAFDEHLLGVVGQHIPILMTDKSLLCYPFGLMDMALLA